MMQSVRPIGHDAVHVAVDMQHLFADNTAWHTPSIPEIVPNILRLTQHRPSRTIFTRFVTPRYPDEGARSLADLLPALGERHHIPNGSFHARCYGAVPPVHSSGPCG